MNQWPFMKLKYVFVPCYADVHAILDRIILIFWKIPVFDPYHMSKKLPFCSVRNLTCKIDTLIYDKSSVLLYTIIGQT